MKKHQSYLVLLFAILFCGTIEAKVNNYIGAYANLAEWSLLPSQSDYSTSFGATGGVGFLYELQAGPMYSTTRFLWDIGLGAFGGASIFNPNSSAFIPLRGQTDREGQTFDFIYDINNRKDSYGGIALQVPVMFGVQHKSFYMMAGLKIHYFLWSQANSTALVSTYGKYNDIIGTTPGEGDLRDNPSQQFYEKVPKSQKGNPHFSFDMDLSFEIGGRIGVVNEDVGFDVPKSKIEYRLAAFVDYGLLPYRPKGGKEVIETPRAYDANSSMLDNLKLNDIMTTSTNGKPFANAVNSLMFGLKFTVLFQMPENGKCVLCQDAYKSSALQFGRPRMKYDE